jgi:hypothetical protein
MKIAGRRSQTWFLLSLVALGFALSASLPAQEASAQNRGTPEQQAACQPDALRLCGDFVPDVDRITACMIKNRMRLSPPCRAVFTQPAHKGTGFKHSS